MHFIANSSIFNSTTVPVDNVQNFLASRVFVNMASNFWRSSLNILRDVLVVEDEFGVSREEDGSDVVDVVDAVGFSCSLKRRSTYAKLMASQFGFDFSESELKLIIYSN